MSSPEPTRLSTELSLLCAMYPSQTTYNPISHDFKFTQDSATLHLRLPDTYPESSQPDLIAATDASKNDLRDQTKAAVHELGLTEGDESLDAIIAAFQQILSAQTERIDLQNSISTSTKSSETEPETDTKPKTVIIWLHHLLNTNKRKLALSPSQPIAGVVKPGYPGIILYTGPTAALNSHVSLLKHQNWQAFQVRYEEEGMWRLAHEGVREVESMSDAVKAVDVDVGQKVEFLKAVGIK